MRVDLEMEVGLTTASGAPTKKKTICHETGKMSVVNSKYDFFL
jgi:hypothetical protein